MKILLVGHGGSYNKGCEAIVKSTFMMLQKHFHNLQFTISTFDYEHEITAAYDSNVKIISAWSNNLWKRFSKDWFKRNLYYRFFCSDRSWELTYSPLIKYLRNSDVVISIGGDNYTNDYGFPIYFLRLNTLAKKYRKRLVIWGASIGPFAKNDSLKDIIENLKLVDLITVREKISYDYLNSLGITQNLKLVADPAFILPLMETGDLDGIISYNKAPFLGFNISPILEQYSKNIKNEYLIKESIAFLRYSIERYGLYVLLIPHVVREGHFNDDRKFMSTIYSQLEGTKMISIIPSGYNAMQIKYIISKCRFFIGARTHATIAAFSTIVPALSISYSPKSIGINRCIFDNEDYLLNINNFSSQTLRYKFENLINEEERIKKMLSEQIPKIKEQSWLNVIYLKELLEGSI